MIDGAAAGGRAGREAVEDAGDGGPARGTTGASGSKDGGASLGGASSDASAADGASGEASAASTTTIGPAGGKVVGAGVQLDVPPEALSKDAPISIRAVSTGYPPLPEGDSLTSEVIALQPHGLAFSKPVDLTVPFTGDDLASLRLITAEPGGSWSTVEGASFTSGSAKASVTHFSYVAVVTSRRVACRLKTETGREGEFRYTYGTDGNVSKIEKYSRGAANLLVDSTDVSFGSVVVHRGVDYPAGSAIITINFDGDIFDGYPWRSEIAITEKGITRVDQLSFYYEFDERGHLKLVGEQTDLFVGDYEYDLHIGYDAQDNAIALGYVTTTGPAGPARVIEASGYDDNPTPYATIPRYYFFMHAAWDNYDPGPLFTALSKHNPLGYTTDSQTTTYAYTYNAHGYPLTKTQTSTNASDSSTSVETYEYDCP